MNRIFLTFALACPAVLLSTHGDAGLKVESASCSKQPDGSGGCSGTLLGFRNNADPNAYAGFRSASNWPGINMLPGFSASLNGVSYGCTFTASQTAVAYAATACRGFFYVKWDAAAKCYDPQLINDSRYSNY